jgi:hypothetical protein
MSTDDTRIQNHCGTSDGIQDTPSRPRHILVSADAGGSPLLRRRYFWIPKGFVVTLLLAILSLLPAAYMCLQAAYPEIVWLGGTDLEITFVVTDSDTGTPIPGAAVHVFYAHSPRDRTNVPFTLTTAANGTVRHWCRGVDCTGRSNPVMPWRNTITAKLPSWVLDATAPGYMDSEPQDLGFSQKVRKPVRRKHGNAAVTIPVTLRKLPNG